MSGIVGLVLCSVLAVGVGWGSTRAWRLRHLGARIGIGISSILATVLLAAVAITGAAGMYRLYTPRGGPPASMTAEATPDQLMLASRRANGCVGCHSNTGQLPLDGGSANFLSGGGPGLGVLVAPNLTPAGPLRDWTDGEIVRAIREGVDRDGHPLLVMPSDALHHLSDTEVQLLVAYLRSQPPVDRATPARDLNLLGLVIVGAGLFPTAEQPHIDQPQTAPTAAETPAFGQHLVDVTGCRICHGQSLEGRTPAPSGPPAGPNLRAIVPTWQAGDFVRFFRTGTDPGNREVDPNRMPWADIGKSYTDDELLAMYAYLSDLT